MCCDRHSRYLFHHKQGETVALLGKMLILMVVSPQCSGNLVQHCASMIQPAHACMYMPDALLFLEEHPGRVLSLFILCKQSFYTQFRFRCSSFIHSLSSRSDICHMSLGREENLVAAANEPSSGSVSECVCALWWTCPGFIPASLRDSCDRCRPPPGTS